ncbi:MAG: phospholipid-binding protein MlaC, partial [Candidatus Fonsibacter sp.]
LSLSNVDLDAVANYTLGEYRQKLSDSEKITFNRLFKDYFVKNVSSKLNDFADQDLKVLGSKKLNETNIVVNTKIFSKKDGQEIIVDWRIYFSNNKYLVRDLVVEGLSLARTQREEFASILVSKGFPELVKILENYIKSN